MSSPVTTLAKCFFVINWKHLKQLFGHINPLSVLLISHQMWHLSRKSLLDFQMFFEIKGMVNSDLPTFRGISRTVKLASPSMISFIFEAISLGYAKFGLPDFGAFSIDSAPD